MRTIFKSNCEVVDVWAKQTQSYGRAGNISFEGSDLYSYAAHIARILPSGQILVSSTIWSPTTSRHQDMARVRDRQYFTVPSLAPDHQVNIKYYLDKMKKAVLRFDRAQTHWRAEWALKDTHYLHTQLQEYCSAFDLSMPVTLGLYLDRNYPFVAERFVTVDLGSGQKLRLFLPKWLAKKGLDNIEPKDLLKIRNAEIRREVIRRLGIEVVCHALKAKTIDRQGEYELVLLDLKDGRRRPYLKMHNPSVPEIWHLEGVHPAITTVQDALNYRRYGEDLFIEPDTPRERWELEINPEQAKIKAEYETSPLFPNRNDWRPTQLT